MSLPRPSAASQVTTASSLASLVAAAFSGRPGTSSAGTTSLDATRSLSPWAFTAQTSKVYGSPLDRSSTVVESWSPGTSSGRSRPSWVTRNEAAAVPPEPAGHPTVAEALAARAVTSVGAAPGGGKVGGGGGRAAPVVCLLVAPPVLVAVDDDGQVAGPVVDVGLATVGDQLDVAGVGQAERLTPQHAERGGVDGDHVTGGPVDQVHPLAHGGGGGEGVAALGDRRQPALPGLDVEGGQLAR